MSYLFFVVFLKGVSCLFFSARIISRSFGEGVKYMIVRYCRLFTEMDRKKERVRMRMKGMKQWGPGARMKQR
jgi:hypothetical protein